MSYDFKVHVVIGVEGEYSEREEYVAGVYGDRATAEALVIEKTAAGRARAQERNDWKERRKRLIEAAEEAKITPEMRSYYAFPQGHLADEDLREISQELGPIPEYIQYDCYYVVTVPMNRWGRWTEYDVKDAAAE